jgi:hypothetical protein
MTLQGGATVIEKRGAHLKRSIHLIVWIQYANYVFMTSGQTDMRRLLGISEHFRYRMTNTLQRYSRLHRNPSQF